MPNHGFEDLDAVTAAPAGWTPWSTPNFAVYTLAAARGGVAAAVITDDCPRTSQGLRSPRVPVEPGSTYRASVWVKIEHARQGGFGLYLEYWIGGTRIHNRSVFADDAADWQHLTVDDPVPADATHATVLVYSSSAAVGRAYFDDASLVRTR